MAKTTKIRIILGKEYQDAITEFTGIAVSRTVFINKCIRVCLQPKVDKDGKHVEDAWFDEEQLVATGKRTKFKEKEEETGGPKSYSVPRLR